MKKHRNLIIVLLLTLPLIGCAGSILKSNEPPQTIYSLRPIEGKGETSDAAAKIIEITSPSVPPGMEQDRIALLTDNGKKLDYYASVRWSSSLDHIVQDFTRRSVSAVLPYVVATTPDQSVTADYRLQTKINEFQPVYKAGSTDVPLLKVNIEFTLIDSVTERIVTSFQLSKTLIATENSVDSVAAGLESLLQEVERSAFIKLDKKLRAHD